MSYKPLENVTIVFSTANITIMYNKLRKLKIA